MPPRPLVETVTPDFFPDLALDLGAGKIYYTEFNPGEIRRVNLDGTGEEVLVTGLTEPLNIALDTVNDTMYWSDGEGLRRANQSASGVQTIVLAGGEGSAWAASPSCLT